MALLGALTDVDVSSVEFECPVHDVLLILEGRARQVEVRLIGSGLLFPVGEESDVEARVVGGLPRTPAQNRPRTRGSCASMQSARR